VITTDLVDVGVFWASITSELSATDSMSVDQTEAPVRLSHPRHPSYKARGGYCREDAILVLRRFYVTENTNGELALGQKF
jgi:hypothetical protein